MTNKIKNDEIQDSFNNENTRYGDHQRRSYFWLQNNDTDEGISHTNNDDTNDESTYHSINHTPKINGKNIFVMTRKAISNA